MKPRPHSLTRSRRWLQGTAVLGTFLIGLRHIMPGEASSGGSFDAFCPFGGVETLLPYLLTGQTLKTTNSLPGMCGNLHPSGDNHVRIRNEN